ncbi:MAG TPA: hypothetical protein PLL69_04905 [Gemmatimonadales bacterium]|nr:hypothetical protein [Gemmatimonadales bacterium]
MKVDSPAVATDSMGTRRVTVRIDDFELWYDVPRELPLASSGEFLLCAALLPAMLQGGELALPDQWPVDRVFLANMERVQETWLGWQAGLRLKLKPVRVRCAETSVGAASIGSGAISFFSGGVDGSFTAQENRSRMSTLLLLRGIDMRLESEALWQEARDAAQVMADHWDLRLSCITSNIRFLGYHNGLKWARHFQAAGLMSVAHLVPHETVLIASSHSYWDSAGYGSHPDLDPLFSSAGVRIEHHGMIPRTEKLAALVEDPVIRNRLRVCWHDHGFNCCKCEKCVRTMVALRLFGVEAPSFPGPLDLGLLHLLGSNHGGHIYFIRELLELEAAHPDPEIRRALRKVARGEQARALLRKLDRSTGGALSSFRRRLAG